MNKPLFVKTVINFLSIYSDFSETGYLRFLSTPVLIFYLAEKCELSRETRILMCSGYLTGLMVMPGAALVSSADANELFDQCE